MHEIIISEKPKSAEKIAKALSSKVQKKKYSRRVSYWEFEEDGKRTRDDKLAENIILIIDI